MLVQKGIIKIHNFLSSRNSYNTLLRAHSIQKIRRMAAECRYPDNEAFCQISHRG
jgi:hypothetical protein